MNKPTLSELRQASDRASRRWPLWKRLAVWVGGLLLAWGLGGYLVGPMLLRSRIQSRLEADLDRPVSIGKVHFNPFLLTVGVDGLAVSEPDGVSLFAGCRRLQADVEMLSLFTGAWRFDEVSVDGFTVAVVVSEKGRLNFADLLAKTGLAAAAGDRAEPAGPRALRIGRLDVTDATLAYTDRSGPQPFSTRIGPTNLRLHDLHTGGAGQAPGEIAVVTESGEQLGWKGTVSFAPLASSGSFWLGGIALEKYAPLCRDQVNFDVAGGTLDAQGDYDFSLADGVPALRLKGTHIVLGSLRLLKRGEPGAPAAALDRVEITGLAADLPRRTAAAARVVIDGGLLRGTRTADGLDLAKMLGFPVAETPATVVRTGEPGRGAEPGTPPDLRVTEFSIRNLAVEFEDRAVPGPVRYRASGLMMDLRNLSLVSLADDMPIGLRASLQDNGLVRVAGSVALKPFKADLAVELSDLQLAGLSPYAEVLLGGRVPRGRLTVLGRVRAGLPAAGAPAVAVSGDVTLSDFAFVAGAADGELARWRSLTVRGIDCDTAAGRYTVADTEWIDPVVRVVTDAGGRSNLGSLLPGWGTGAPVVAIPSVRSTRNGAPRREAVGKPVFVVLDRVAVENGGCEYVDESVQPAVRMAVDRISGSVDGLSSSELARATVELRGRMGGASPLMITGKFNPFAGRVFSDLRFTARAVDLTPLSSYVRKYGGHELAQGTLTLDARCRITQRKVDGLFMVALDQVALGARVDGPGVTDLPLSLAVALARDPAGRISLDVPVRGSLDDRTFDAGRVLVRGLLGPLHKAKEAPFTQLASVVGERSGEMLSFQEFAAGATVLQPEETGKLDIVAKALRARPAVSLELQGGWNETIDSPMVREQALELEMRRIIWADLKRIQPDIALADVQLIPEQKMGMVRRLYYKTFPNEAQRRQVDAPASIMLPKEPSRPVPAQRGNLGAFLRSDAAVERAPAMVPPAAGAQPDMPGLSGLPAVQVIKPPSLAKMKEKLLARIKVTPEELCALADARARAVREYLVTAGEVPAAQVVVVPSVAGRSGVEPVGVNLRLR